MIYFLKEESLKNRLQDTWKMLKIGMANEENTKKVVLQSD
jgi:hypothetical protein